MILNRKERRAAARKIARDNRKIAAGNRRPRMDSPSERRADADARPRDDLRPEETPPC
jgi:hypothetical protein